MVNDWLNQRALSTDPEDLRNVDQGMFLDGLKSWAARYLDKPLSNDLAAELAMVNRNVFEAWRTSPSAATHRRMPLARRMLLVFRLLELLPNMPRYTPEEEALIRDCWGKRSVSQIAMLLQRTPTAIDFKARQMGLPFKEPHLPFSAEELELIARDYKQVGAVVLAERLGRSAQAVRNKAAKLGVKGQIGRPRKRR